MQQIFLNYGVRLAITAISLFSSVILFCYLVDPFSAYGRIFTQENSQINSPAFTAQLRLGKAVAIAQRQPEILIMGSSRSGLGIASASAQKYFDKKKVYNASIPGSSSYELLRYFQHAVASAPIEHVIIGLDFFAFNGGKPIPNEFKEERLSVDKYNTPNTSLSNKINTLLSLDALFYSLKIFINHSNWNNLYLADGFIQHGIIGGWEATFTATANDYVLSPIVGYNFPKFTFSLPKTTKTSLDHLKQIIQLAHEKKIKLDLFISPSHARQWEVIAQLGLWDKWEYWKREMLRITEQESIHHTASPFPIYDFSGYTHYSTEPVPKLQGAPMMKWYSDSSHYRHALGDIILESIKSGGNTGFGTILTSKNIDSHLQHIHAGHIQYAKKHQQHTDMLRKIIEKSHETKQ